MASDKYPYFDQKTVKALSLAIIKNAVNDYMDALIQNDVVEISNCEKFFRSKDGWFDWLSNGLDGEQIMAIVKKKINKFLKACEEHQPEKFGDRKAAKEASFTCPCCGNEDAPVNITFLKRRTRQPNVLTFTCPTCHLTVWWQWKVGLVLREQSCNNCIYCTLVGTEEFCMLDGFIITKKRNNCKDWMGRIREEIS